MDFESSADDEGFVASAPVEGSGQGERQVQALRVSYRELQVHVQVQVQVQVNAESKFFVSHCVNCKSMSELAQVQVQVNAESKFFVSHIVNCNNRKFQKTKGVTIREPVIYVLAEFVR